MTLMNASFCWFWGSLETLISHFGNTLQTSSKPTKNYQFAIVEKLSFCYCIFSCLSVHEILKKIQWSHGDKAWACSRPLYLDSHVELFFCIVGRWFHTPKMNVLHNQMRVASPKSLIEHNLLLSKLDQDHLLDIYGLLTKDGEDGVVTLNLSSFGMVMKVTGEGYGWNVVLQCFRARYVLIKDGFVQVNFTTEWLQGVSSENRTLAKRGFRQLSPSSASREVTCEVLNVRPFLQDFHCHSSAVEIDWNYSRHTILGTGVTRQWSNTHQAHLANQNL